MAVSEDTGALVAAQLTTAWAQRMGQATAGDQGTVGPNLLDVYRTFLKGLEPEPVDVGSWISSYKDE